MRRTVLLATALVLLSGCERFRDWWNVDLGAQAGEACTLSSECEPGLACAHDGTCQTYGDPGTYAPGDDCGHSQECGYGYVCASDWACAEPGQPGTGGDDDACVTDDDCQIGFDCDDSGACEDAHLPYWAGVSCAADDRSGPFRAYFEVPELPLAGETEFYRLPFPNDIRAPGGEVDLSGHPSPGDAVTGDPVGAHLAALEDLDAVAGLNPAVFFRFSRSHLVASVVAFEDQGNTLHYVDVTAGSPTYGPRNSFSWRTGNSRGRYHCQNWLSVPVYAGFPLEPEGTYAVYLTQGIQAEDGDLIQADDDFAAVMDSERPVPDHLAAAWDAYRPLREYLAAAELDATDVVAAAVFTTGSPADTTDGVEAVVDLAAVAPEPHDITLCDADVTSPCDGGGTGSCETADGRFHELHGRVSVAALRATGTELAADGTDTVCFSLTVPTGTAPTGGWPVLVYGADDTENFRAAVTTGLAGAVSPTLVDGVESVALATLTLDPLDRGERRDQFDDPDTSLEGGWQAAADLWAALALLDQWTDDGSLTGQPITLSDEDRVFVGRGLGAEAAALGQGGSDAFTALVLASAGAYRTEAVLHQQEPDDLLAALEQTLADSTVSRYHPVLNLYQQLYDATDPLSVGHLFVADVPAGVGDRHLLQVFGLSDQHTPEQAQLALQRVLQLPTAGDLLVDFGQSTTTLPASGNLYNGSDHVTAVSIQAAGGADALLDEDVLRQVVHFLATAVTEETPTVPR